MMGVVGAKKGRRQARGIARRQQILDAAFDLFAAHGYRSATLAMVAEAVGLTEAGVIHHFPTKEALLLAVLEARDSGFADTEMWLAAGGGALDTLRRFPATARVLVDQPRLARLDVVVGGESVALGGPALEYVKVRMTAVRQSIRGLLAEGVRRGELRDDIDVDAKADEVVAFMSGIQQLWLLDPTIDLVAAYEGYVAGLEASLSAGTRSRKIRTEGR